MRWWPHGADCATLRPAIASHIVTPCRCCCRLLLLLLLVLFCHIMLEPLWERCQLGVAALAAAAIAFSLAACLRCTATTAAVLVARCFAAAAVAAQVLQISQVLQTIKVCSCQAPVTLFGFRGSCCQSLW
jgi:hypothetical protein